MKLNKEKFKKFIEVLQGYYSKMKDGDIIDTNKMSITNLDQVDDNPDKFQIYIKDSSVAKELKKIKWGFFNKNHNYYEGHWYRNKYSNNVYVQDDWRKFPKTKIVDVEFIKEYVANKK